MDRIAPVRPARPVSRIGPVGPARSLSYGARHRLAAILRAHRDDSQAIEAVLRAYGAAFYDFIMLMVGPGEFADRVLADTMIAATGLVDWLRDDDLLTAWVFALARHQCRRHPPVVWRERHWRELRSIPVDRSGSVPVEVVRMALLGIAPTDRELLLLSSTYCKLLSSDLAAIFGMSAEGTAEAVAGAHRRFEQALAMSAAEVGYQRDPRGRAPEIGELVGIAMRGVDRPVPTDRVLYMALAPAAAGHRREVLSSIELGRQDGFPVLRTSGRRVDSVGSPQASQRLPRHAPRSLMSTG